MIRLKEALVVEGKYDQMKLTPLVDGLILRTDGFRLFRDREKCALLKKLADTVGLIVLTDSDVAGFQIRNYIKSVVGSDRNVRHLYIPRIEGKERRKRAPSKEGTLGVEGMTEEVLKALLESVSDGMVQISRRRPITKLDFYEDGLSGREDSSAMRKALLNLLELPPYLSANALLELLNALYSFEEYQALLESLQG